MLQICNIFFVQLADRAIFVKNLVKNLAKSFCCFVDKSRNQ